MRATSIIRVAMGVTVLLIACARLMSAQSPAFTVTFTDSDRHAFTAAERAVIRQIAERAVSEARELLPTLPRAIALEVAEGAQVIPETGEGGVALAPGRIAWRVDATRPGGPAAIAEAHLRATMLHELHHLTRGWTIEGGTVGSRIIDAAVSEGLATAFARDVTGQEAPWAVYPPEVATWVEELVATPPPTAYAEWMFLHPDGRRWIGYRAGTYLADQAMNRSGRSAASLVGVPTDSLLTLADVVR